MTSICGVFRKSPRNASIFHRYGCPARFSFSRKIALRFEVIQRSKAASRRVESAQSFQFPKRWKSKPRFHREGAAVSSLLPPAFFSLALPISLFPILFRDSGEREEFAFAGVEAKPGNWKPSLPMSPSRHGGIRAKGGTQFPQESVRHICLPGSGGNIARQQIRICIAVRTPHECLPFR